MPKEIRRLVVVSNRLPVTVATDEEGNLSLSPGSGGLVTALSPVLRNRGGLWIGWPGTGTDSLDDALRNELLAEGSRESGYRLVPVDLTPAEVEGFYTGFSNEVLWMLFHDFISLCNFEPAYWPMYQQVNRKYAEMILHHAHRQDYIWVHDYHLLLVAAQLRAIGAKQRSGFFLHTPFPPLDVFLKLPWRGAILEGMLEYDLVGFQTMRDMRNFIQCAHRLIPGTHTRTLEPVARAIVTSVRAAFTRDARDQVNSVVTLRTPHRELRVGAFPISIDFKDFMRRAAQTDVNDEVARIAHLLPKGKLVFGLDRLDYSKGIPLRLRAFNDALAEYPELRGNICLLQVVIPSRLDGERYQLLKREIDRLVGDINGRYSEAGWTPVTYLFRSLAPHELLAYYRRSDIALVTPLKDGMNLIAKEYCACQLDDDGVLILSEFAGSAAQLSQDALLVNPYDIRGLAAAIHRAYYMEPSERHRRMRNLRRSVLKHNVFQWVDSFLSAAISKRIKDFPPVEDYVPDLHHAPAPIL